MRGFFFWAPMNAGNGFFMVNSVVALIVLAARDHYIQVITPTPDVAGNM